METGRVTGGAPPPPGATGGAAGPRPRWIALAILGAALVVGWPLLLPWVYDTHDGHYALYNAAEFDRALRDGQFPVRWLPDLFGGRGLPQFVFYPPLAFYLLSIVHLAGPGFIASIKILYLLSLVFSGFAMYAWLREWCSLPAAGAGAVAWLLVPFHVVEIHVKGDPPAALAYVFIPLVLLSIRRAAAGRHGGVASLAASSAGLVLSHAVTTLVVLPAIVLYALAELWGRGLWTAGAETRPAGPRPAPLEADRRAGSDHDGGTDSRARSSDLPGDREGGGRELPGHPAAPPRLFGRGAAAALRLAAGALLGALASAFFWLPALSEKGLVHIDSVLGILFFDYHDHFVAPWQLLSPLWGYHGSFPGTNDDMAFQLGPIQAAAIIAGLLLALRRGHDGRRRHLLWALAVTALGLAMMLEVSRPVWEIIGPLRYAQFPWRFLTPVALASSVLVALLVDALAPRKILWGAAAAPVLVTLVFGAAQSNRWYLLIGGAYAAAGAGVLVFWRLAGRPHAAAPLLLSVLLATTAAPWSAVPLHSRFHREPPIVPIREADLAADRVRLGVRRTTARDDYLPRSVRTILPRDPSEEYLPPPSATAPPDLIVLSGSLPSPTVERSSRSFSIAYAAPEPVTVALTVHDFPGWSAYISPAGAGALQPLPHRCDAEGRIVLDLPAGANLAELRFERTPDRLAADLLGLAGLVSILLAMRSRRF